MSKLVDWPKLSTRPSILGNMFRIRTKRKREPEENPRTSFALLRKKRQSMKNQKEKNMLLTKQIEAKKKDLIALQKRKHDLDLLFLDSKRIEKKHLLSAEKYMSPICHPIFQFVLNVHPLIQGTTGIAFCYQLMERLESDDFKRMKQTCKNLCLHIESTTHALDTWTSYYNDNSFEFSARKHACELSLSMDFRG